MSVASAIRGMITLAQVVRSTAAAARHVFLDTLAHREDRVPHWQPYGLQAAPREGSVAVLVASGGHSDELFAILVHDRRYSIALADGEVAVVDDLGQKVHLTRDGIVVDAPSSKLGAAASLGVARETDPVTINSAWSAWLTSLAAAVPFGTTPPTAPIGAITSGSTVTRSE